MITEDRRRRISSARQIHDNATRIKSSSKYHGSGKTVLYLLGNEAADDAIWLAGDPSLMKLTRESNKALKKKKPGQAPPRELPLPIPITKYDPACSPSLKYELAISSPYLAGGNPIHIYPDQWKGFPKSLPGDPGTSLAKESTPPPLQLTKVQVHNRQHRVANDVLRLLNDHEDPGEVEAAAMRFLDAFEEGLPIGDDGIAQILVDAAANLSEACRRHSMFSYSETVLDIILRHPPIDEASFHRFKPLEVISNLLSRKGMDNDVPLPEYNLKKASSLYLSENKLRKASDIYLMTFKEYPKLPPDAELFWSVGDKLCRETCLAGLYELTYNVFWRAQIGRTKKEPDGRNSPRKCVDCLMIAANATGRDKKVYHYFRQLYQYTSPGEVQFYQISDMVMDSCLKNGKLEVAKNALFIADDMAKRGGFPSSTTLILKVIGHHWRKSRNITEMQELFTQLEPLAQNTHHPQAVYGAMIQSCVEAGEENMARSYYARYRQRYTPVQADLRIYGHFALAKAMRRDWAGVTEALQNMALLKDSENQGDFESSFVPVLKEFEKSHSVDEVEEFVCKFIDHHNLTLTNYLNNFMINVYAKGKYLDSMVRWIEYAASAHCPMDAVSFNSILHNCHQRWKYSFEQSFQLFTKIHKLAVKGGAKEFSDSHTLEILGRIAVKKSRSDDEFRRRFSLLKGLGRSKQLWDCAGVFRAMSSTFATGQHAAAVKIYRLALEKGVDVQSRHVLLAVRASLKLPTGDDVEAIGIIKYAQQLGKDISLPAAALIIHHLDLIGDDTRWTPVSKLLQFSDTAVSGLQKAGILISQAILNHTIVHLEKRFKGVIAIEFWKAMCRRLKIETSAIDLESLTTLLKMYIQLEDANGIRWVVHMLSANGIVPDKRFLLYVKGAKNKAERISDLPTAHRLSAGFVSSLLYATNEVLETRRKEEEGKELVKKMTRDIVEKAILEQSKGYHNVGWGRKPMKFDSHKVDVSEDYGFRIEEDMIPNLVAPTPDMFAARAA